MASPLGLAGPENFARSPLSEVTMVPTARPAADDHATGRPAPAPPTDEVAVGLDEDALAAAGGGPPIVLPASMALPFAVLGAAATWFSLLGVAFLVRDARFTSPWPAPVVGAAVAMAAAVVLRRWRGLHHPDLPSDRRLLRIALVIGVAGALIGAAVTAWTAPGAFETAMGAVGGLGCAMIFVPGASFVVEAAARATRARHGSIVAGADRRTIWGTTLAAIAIAPTLAVPAVAVGRASFALDPLTELASIVLCAVVALVALAALEMVEHRARARLEVAIADAVDLEDASATDVVAAGARDLGLGEAGRARRHLRDAYRGARHAEIVLRGDADQARLALDDAVARRRRGCVVALAALACTFPGAFGLTEESLARLSPPAEDAAASTRTRCEEGTMGTPAP